MGLTVPAGARPSRANSVCACAMAPSAVSTANTARLLPSGDMPRRALATAPVFRAPGMTCAGRLVMSPAKTPPSSLLGAPASGMPPGSRIELETHAFRPLRGARKPQATKSIVDRDAERIGDRGLRRRSCAW